MEYVRYQISKVKSNLLKARRLLTELSLLTHKDEGDFHALISKCENILIELKEEE